MINTVKNYEELKFTDDYMFTIVCEYYPNIVKGLIKRILGIDTTKLSKHSSQYSISNSVNSKSIRFDVYVQDELSHQHFNIEMQTTRDPALAKRGRYYRSSMDNEVMKKGKKYKSLPNTFVIFICNYQPFPGMNGPISVEPGSLYDYDEEKGIITKDITKEAEYDPGCAIIYVNTKADLSKVKNKDLRALLEYLNTGKVTDAFTLEIENAVQEQRQNSLERSRYMTFEQELRDSQDMWYEQGIVQGIEQGMKQGIEQGMAQGINKNKKDVVLGMNAKGLSISDISDIVKLSISQVNEILETNSNEAPSITLPSR